MERFISGNRALLERDTIVSFYIDLNCDLGEVESLQEIGPDVELLGYATSINVACGGHAGNREVMKHLSALAIAKNIAIGAHPGFPDRENFGRLSMAMPRSILQQTVVDQVGTLVDIVRELGGQVTHIKPHGALYNDACRDEALAGTLTECIAKNFSDMMLVGASGSLLLGMGREQGLDTVSEVFADRNYHSDGRLVPRSQPLAVLGDVMVIARRAVDMVLHRRVQSVEATWVMVQPETICLHGDTPNALAIADEICDALLDHDIKIQSFVRK